MPFLSKYFIIIFILCLHGFSALTAAKDMSPGQIRGDVELGFMYTTGNTDSTSVRVNSEFTHDLEYFRNRYQLFGRIQKTKQLNADTGHRDHIITASRYGFSGQSNYKFLEGTQSMFGRASYIYNKFGSFIEQGTIAAGYANRIYEDASVKDYLDLETGPGFSHQQTSSGVINTGLIWFMAMNLDYSLFAGSRFRQAFEGTVSLDGANSTFFSRSSVTSKIYGSLSMRFNFIVKYNSQPEGNLRNTDTETSASLVYSF